MKEYLIIYVSGELTKQLTVEARSEKQARIKANAYFRRIRKEARIISIIEPQNP